LLHGDFALAMLLRDRDASLLGLLRDLRFLVVLDRDQRRLLALVAGNARSLVLLTRVGDRDLLVLFGFRLGAPLLEAE
jgi:hypothetical protein